MEVQHIFLVNQNWKDINPMECGQERCAPGHSFGPGVREYYLLHYVLSGVGRFTVSGTTYTLHAGDIFVIRPFERIYYEADAEAPWHYVWAGFEASVPLPEALSQDVIRCPDARAVFLEMLEAGKLEQGRERCLCGRIWLLLSMLEHMESAGPRGSDYVLDADELYESRFHFRACGGTESGSELFQHALPAADGPVAAAVSDGAAAGKGTDAAAGVRLPARRGCAGRGLRGYFQLFAYVQAALRRQPERTSQVGGKACPSEMEKSPPGGIAGRALSIFAGAALNTGSSSRRRIRGRWSRAGRMVYRAAAARAPPA